ncbi:UDP-glucose 4-epimerase [Bradyrhizobium sp. AZCC 1693]
MAILITGGAGYIGSHMPRDPEMLKRQGSLSISPIDDLE